MDSSFGRTKLIGLGAGAVLLALAVPSSAEAGWVLPAKRLAGPHKVHTYGVTCPGRANCGPGLNPSSFPRVLMDARGTATLVYGVWDRSPDNSARLLMRSRPASGAWSRPVRVARNGHFGWSDLGGDPIAGNARGDAVVVWGVPVAGRFAKTDYYAATRSFGGQFGRRQRIVRNPRRVTDVAMNARGDAVAVWERSPSAPVSDEDVAVGAAFRPAGGRWHSGRPIARGEITSGPFVATDDKGGAVMVWAHGDSRSRTVRASIRRPGRGFGPPRRISPRGVGDSLSVAMNARGRAVALWSDRRGRFRISTRRPGRRFGGRAAVVSRRGHDEAPAAVAMNPRGDMVAAWVRMTVGNRVRRVLETLFRRAGGRPLGRRANRVDVARGGHNIQIRDLVIDSQGNAYLAWQRGARKEGEDQLKLAARPFGGRFGHRVSLGTPRTSSVGIAAGALGDPIAVWSHMKGRSRTESVFATTFRDG